MRASAPDRREACESTSWRRGGGGVRAAVARAPVAPMPQRHGRVREPDPAGTLRRDRVALLGTPGVQLLEVTVWLEPPLFVQVTTAPVSTVVLLGVNALSVMLMASTLTVDAGSTMTVACIFEWKLQ